MRKSVDEIKGLVRSAVPRLNAEERQGRPPISLNKLDEIDIARIQNEFHGNWSYEIWDKVSPINGVPAEQVLERYPYITPDMEVYLVRQSGRVVIFQPHLPEAEGIQKMTRDDVHLHAENHKNRVVDDFVIQRVIQLLDE